MGDAQAPAAGRGHDTELLDRIERGLGGFTFAEQARIDALFLALTIVQKMTGEGERPPVGDVLTVAEWILATGRTTDG